MYGVQMLYTYIMAYMFRVRFYHFMCIWFCVCVCCVSMCCCAFGGLTCAQYCTADVVVQYGKYKFMGTKMLGNNNIGSNSSGHNLKCNLSSDSLSLLARLLARLSACLFCILLPFFFCFFSHHQNTLSYSMLMSLSLCVT